MYRCDTVGDMIILIIFNLHRGCFGKERKKESHMLQGMWHQNDTAEN
jgi:hypothetical protein